MPDQYILYGAELSLFTRKLESALVWYGLPFSRRAKTVQIQAEIDQRSGTHQMPVLQTPENWMLADTTPIMMLLDGRYPRRAMFSRGPLGFLIHVIEEYFDEWVARVMVHYRWHYPASAKFAAERLTREMLAGADETAIAAAIAETPIANWGLLACRATGTGSASQQLAAEREYEALLDAMSQQLSQTRFLLGDRPCAAHANLPGGLLAHTNMDPDPKKMVGRFPRVVDWCTRDALQWNGDGELIQFPDSTPFARKMLAAMSATYVSFIRANAKALAHDDKAFTVKTYGEDVSYMTRAYPERSRRMIVNRFNNQLDDHERSIVRDWLAEFGLYKCFAIADLAAI